MRLVIVVNRQAKRTRDPALLDPAVRQQRRDARPAQARGGGFRVSLGTIPDYGANVDGVRLSGVRKDGAAEKAGLRKGDVIVRIGTRDIHNLDDYMASFGELEAGSTVAIVVVRDGKRVELQMVPQSPQPR